MSGLLDAKTKIGIYKILNKLNGRVYVGSALKLKKRWNTHLYRLRHHTHHNQFLSNDFKKCGELAFEFVILEGCNESQLLEREQFWLDQYYDDQDMCYNLRKVAESNRGFKMSTSTRQKMSMAKKGQSPSLKTIEASRKIRLGTKLSMETCAKMAAYQKNRSEEHKKNIGKAIVNVWKMPEYREYQSEVHRKPALNRRKKIAQYTLEGVLVGTYLGADEASRVTGVAAGNIRQVASRTGNSCKKTAGGFIWKYEK